MRVPRTRPGTGDQGEAVECFRTKSANSGLCPPATARNKEEVMDDLEKGSTSDQRIDLERHGVTPRPNAPPPAYRKPRRRAVLCPARPDRRLGRRPRRRPDLHHPRQHHRRKHWTRSQETLESFDQAQAFTTGGHAARIHADVGVDQTCQRTVASDSTCVNTAVSIRTDASWEPIRAPICSAPSPVRPPSLATQVNAYATAGIDLAANTTYFVLVDSSSAARHVDLQNTA